MDALPDTARVGGLAYGVQVDDAPVKHAPGCEDIRARAPVGAVDKDRLRGEIDGLEARGYTPIGNALRAAADDLSADAAERSIVLVSRSEEHTSELQSRFDLVCRLLLEKKK